jgi:protein required for attachment to host cells
LEHLTMELSGTTWIVAADGTHARVFEERCRAGDVRELPERAVRALESEYPRAHRHLATVHDRHGSGQHAAGERSLSEEAARRFMKRLAEQLHVAARDGDFDSLVLMAPPHALGLLRAALCPALHQRVTATDQHERLRCNAEEVRERLRKVRASGRTDER